jgi:hypothetical protein
MESSINMKFLPPRDQTDRFGKRERLNQDLFLKVNRKFILTFEKLADFFSCLVFKEEVPLYTPKGKRNLTQLPPGYPPGWHPSAVSTATTSKAKTQKPKAVVAERTGSQAIEKPKAVASNSQTQKKAEKSKKEKKEVDFNAVISVDEINDKLQDASIDPTIEISKRLKRLRRRLRESEQLEEKIKSGENTNPDQLEKCSRKKEIEDEINQLEDERNKLRQLKASKDT